MYKYQIALFMYKQMNGILPMTGSFSFVTNDSIHDHYTRGLAITGWLLPESWHISKIR